MIFQCPRCKKEYEDKEIDEDKVLIYKLNRIRIQDLFPNLTVYQREYIITGYCKECQDIIFNYLEHQE